MVAQFTAKRRNLEKNIYFLLLMSYSINKLKSHMLFSCQNFMFSILRGMNFLLKEMMRGLVPLTPAPSPPTIFILTLLFVHTVYANFDFNQFSIFTEYCF